MLLPFDDYSPSAKVYSEDQTTLNCPNCGAPINGDKCEYCGTYFVDYGCLDTEKPFWLKIKCDGQTILIPVKLINYEQTCESPVCYYDNEAYTSVCADRKITLEFKIVN